MRETLIPFSPILSDYTGLIVHVQAFPLASLSTFLVMLSKQQLNRYISTDMRGTAIECSQNRQRKPDGIISWYFDHEPGCNGHPSRGFTFFFIVWILFVKPFPDLPCPVRELAPSIPVNLHDTRDHSSISPVFPCCAFTSGSRSPFSSVLRLLSYFEHPRTDMSTVVTLRSPNTPPPVSAEVHRSG